VDRESYLCLRGGNEQGSSDSYLSTYSFLSEAF